MSFFAKKQSSRLGTTQTVSTSTTSAAATNAFGAQTYQIRVVATVATNIKIGNGSVTATTSDPLVPANVPEYFTVTPGQKIAAILGTGTGSLYVTEMS